MKYEDYLATQDFGSYGEFLSGRGKITSCIHLAYGLLHGKMKGKTALDVGTRDGFGVEYLLQVGFEKAKGLELVPGWVKYACSQKREVYQGDIHSPPFKDESFDFILARHVIEHCHNAKRVMKQIFRILKSKGLLLAVFPIGKNQPRKRKHLTYFNRGIEFNQIAKETGFEKVLSGRSKRWIKPTQEKEWLYAGRRP